MRTRNPRRLTAIGLVLALSTLASISAMMIRGSAWSSQTEADVVRTGAVIAAGEAVVAQLQRVISPGRADGSASNGSLPAARADSMSELESAVGRLERLTADDPTQQQRVAELRLLLDAVHHAQDEGGDPAEGRSARTEIDDPLPTEGREALVSEVRALVAEIRGEEERLLDQRNREGTRSASFVQRLIVSMGLVSAVILTAVFGALFFEIGQRLAAEDAARRHATEVEDLYNRAPCGYHSLDAEGRFVHINDTELDWLGYAREDVVGRLRFTDVVTAEGAAEFARNFPILLEEGFVHDLDFDMLRKDGSRLAVSVSATAIRDADGRFISSRSTVFDVTTRKRLEEELDHIFTLSQDLLCIADASGELVRINPAWEHVLGYSLVDIVNCPFLDFVHPEDQAATQAVFEEQIHGGNRITSFENRYRAKDGDYRVLLWNSTPVASEGRVYASARDITERKRSEDALHSAKLEAEAANLELEAFSYSVSHDLRAPLRAIDGFSTALLEDHANVLGSDGVRHLERVRSATRRMSDLIDDLLELSRLSRRQIVSSRVDLSAIAEDVVGQLRLQEPERTVEVRIQTGLVAMGDHRLLRVVLENLLGNAWKYTRKTEDAEVEMGRGVIDGLPAWWVRDNGAGFDMAYADRLFGAFQRLHRADEFEGTGIGLATAQRIIRRHGGRIWAEAAVDEGATFHFTLGPQEGLS